MRTFAKKPKATQQTTSAKAKKPSQTFLGQSRAVHSILHLQRTIGNQDVLRLLQIATENVDASSASSALIISADDFSQTPVQAAALSNIQPKLTVSAPGDRSEQEADRIANEVLRQTMPEEGDEKVDIQAKVSQQTAGGKREVNEDLDNWLSRSKGGGNPITDQVRAFVEPRMQYDFSKVLIHTDNGAARLNQELGARAFTYGRDIYFGAGQYNPQSIEGQRLLAHELVHVLQQSAGPTSTKSSFRLRSNRKNTVQRAVLIETPQRRGNLFAGPRLPELVRRLNAIHPGTIRYEIRADNTLRCEVLRPDELTGFDISMRDWLTPDQPEIPLRFINQHQQVTVDWWGGEGLVDIDDLLGATDISFQLNILHILEERFSSPGYAEGTAASGRFGPAHIQALLRERDHLRDRLGDNDIEYVGERTTLDGRLVFLFRRPGEGGYDIQHIIGNRGQQGHLDVVQNDRRIPLEEFLRRRAAL